MLVFVLKQHLVIIIIIIIIIEGLSLLHLVKVILFANILIGPAYPGQFASKISIISTFLFI